ncbi:MAG: hypothetical protein CVU48_09630 [Candidatus Cloacimonetes bacterium HGW-Cloacimonetes-1]|jgi:DNA-directed RNA polymerase specialized sigma24 family protein|nr:MAG: hypothetical protein CVU48_09630 [Candidatus Cloacimonetes bacterium HGW-Cloacimonetes-1]
MELTEKDYHELYQYSLKAAYHFVGYKDEAYDIAQNALLSFISSKSKIDSPHSWLRIVLRREATKLFESQKKYRDLQSKAPLERSIAPKTEDMAESDRIIALDYKKVKKILSTDDYEIYKKIKKAGFSIQEYANKEDIPYNTAKNHKNRIKRNILANLLWNDGWRHSTKILNFSQFNNINRFISSMLSAVKNNSIDDLIHYKGKLQSEEIMTVLGSVSECLEWSISCVNGQYKCSLSCIQDNEAKCLVTMNIEFKAKNIINMTAIHLFHPILVVKGSSKQLQRHKKKGKLELSFEEFMTNYKTILS